MTNDEDNNADRFTELYKGLLNNKLENDVKFSLAQDIFLKFLQSNPEAVPDDIQQYAKKAWQAANIFGLASRDHLESIADSYSDLIRKSFRRDDDYGYGQGGSDLDGIF